MKGRPAPVREMMVDGRPIADLVGEDMIRALVHGFYDKVRGDALIGPIFNSVIAPDDWPEHLAKMCDFWSSLMLGTDRYAGRPLPPHLAIPTLGEAHFRRWLTLFRETARGLFPADLADLFMDRALRIAHSFRLALSFHRNEGVLDLPPITEESLT